MSRATTMPADGDASSRGLNPWLTAVPGSRVAKTAGDSPFGRRRAVAQAVRRAFQRHLPIASFAGGVLIGLAAFMLIWRIAG